MSRHHVTVTVNGELRQAEVEARKLLVHFLRDDLGVTSTHVGCDTTQCGACTVHLDGRAVKSCTILAVQADGAAVDTVEALSKTADGEHPLLSAFREHHALQCGFCTPGMIMSSLELLRREPRPSEERIRAWLKGNFCRCTGYQHIVDAIGAAGEEAVRPGAADSTTPQTRVFGQPMPRREDDHHLRGRGRFTDDVRAVAAASVLHVTYGSYRL
jgi:carbon-monoxide dehydrogenase small subunit